MKKSSSWVRQTELERIFNSHRYQVKNMLSIVSSIYIVWSACWWTQHASEKSPGIVDQTFENRTRSNSIRGLSSIEFGSRTKSNTTLSVSSISEQIEFNRTNRTQSNTIKWISFDWLWWTYTKQAQSKPVKASFSCAFFTIYSRVPLQYTFNASARRVENFRIIGTLIPPPLCQRPLGSSNGGPQTLLKVKSMHKFCFPCFS